MLTESDRRATFARLPVLMGFLSTALQDLQQNEDEAAADADRDVGTIWSCPEATFRAAERECLNFAKVAGPTIEQIQHLSRSIEEGLGSDLYLERAGHGAGFADRDYYSDDRDENRRIGEALSGSVEPRGTLELYVGDDGAAWIAGREQAV